MKIENGKLVTITYSLYVDGFNGELVETINESEPAVFMFGVGEMLESFEEKIKGLSEGDSFKFMLKKEEAYGDDDPEAVVEFPKSMFTEDTEGLPEIGDYVPMEDEEGNVFDGVAIDITEDMVIIDFNHPLAGEDLYFEGKIVKVEDAQ